LLADALRQLLVDIKNLQFVLEIILVVCQNSITLNGETNIRRFIMNIDMKRLETSREYWDEIAPEGAEVYRGCGLFSKWVDGIEQVCDTAEGWIESPSP
jgi:hypothetical protein